MIIDKLTKLKNGKYSIIINDKSYELDEDIIIEYRLVKGTYIDDEILNNALKKNDLKVYYHKALNYALNYSKSSYEIYNYLLDKGLGDAEARQITKEIDSKGIITDELIAMRLVDYYIRKAYGINYIINKLREKRINNEIINALIADIDYDIYYEALDKLYHKAKAKYKGNEYEIKMKITKYLLSRGYTYDDINTIRDN